MIAKGPFYCPFCFVKRANVTIYLNPHYFYWENIRSFAVFLSDTNDTQI